MKRRQFLAGIMAAVAAGPAALLKKEEASPPEDTIGPYAKKMANLGKKGMEKIEEERQQQLLELADRDIISDEALEDIRNWGVDEIDEQTRREIYREIYNDVPKSEDFKEIIAIMKDPTPFDYNQIYWKRNQDFPLDFLMPIPSSYFPRSA